MDILYIKISQNMTNSIKVACNLKAMENGILLWSFREVLQAHFIFEKCRVPPKSPKSIGHIPCHHFSYPLVIS